VQHRSGSNQRLTYEGILSFVLYHFSLLKCPVIRVFRECVSRVDSCPCPRDLASRVSVPVHVSSVGPSSINDTSVKIASAIDSSIPNRSSFYTFPCNTDSISHMFACPNVRITGVTYSYAARLFVLCCLLLHAPVHVPSVPMSLSQSEDRTFGATMQSPRKDASMERILHFPLQDPQRNLQRLEESQPNGCMILDQQYTASMTSPSSIPSRTGILESHSLLRTTSKWELKQLAVFCFRFVTNMVY
jgi:hypothetical protein